MDTKIIYFEIAGFEMNIDVVSDGNDVLDDSKTLKEIVDLAVSEGFTRFVGTAGESDDKPEMTFIFSKEGYFDEDDCLVRNPEASIKINKLLAEKTKQ